MIAETYRYQIAVLLEHFHLPLPMIGDLTDRQIKELYNHARDKDGVLIPPDNKVNTKRDVPEVPKSLKEELFQLDMIQAAIPGGLKNYKELVEGIKKKWADKEQNG